MTTDTTRYQAWLHREIPLSAAMGLELTALDLHHCATRAPLARNRNVHGTGFAGSLYAQAMLTAWVHLIWHLEQVGMDAQLVQREGTIVYREPVIADPVCDCSIDESSLSAFRDTLTATGRAAISVSVEIFSGTEAAACLAAEYSAKQRTS